MNNVRCYLSKVLVLFEHNEHHKESRFIICGIETSRPPMFHVYKYNLFSVITMWRRRSKEQQWEDEWMTVDWGDTSVTQSSPPENRTYQWMIEEKKKRGGVGERNEVGRCLDEHKVSVCAAGQKKDVIRRKRGSVWGWQNVERKKKTGVWVSWWCSYCDSFNLWSNEGI